MNLYFRLIWIIGCSLLKPKINFFDEIILKLRVLPNDIDINRHLNNGRYLTILDLGSIGFFLRSGIAFRIIRNGLKPIIGGSFVTYRKSLSLFEPYKLTLKLEAWDEKWNYFKFEFKKANGQVSATGYFKSLFISKNGVVPNNVIDEMFSFKRKSIVLPPPIESWLKAEKDIPKRFLLNKID